MQLSVSDVSSCSDIGSSTVTQVGYIYSFSTQSSPAFTEIPYFVLISTHNLCGIMWLCKLLRM